MPNSGQNALVLLGDVNFSERSKMWDFAIEVALHDVTTFGSTGRKFIPGLMTMTATWGVLLDSDRETDLNDVLAASEYFAFARSRGALDNVWIGKAINNNQSPGIPVDGVVEATGALQSDDDFWLGSLLYPYEERSKAGGSAQELTGQILDGGAASADGALALCYVYGHTPGGSGGVGFEIEHREGFVSETLGGTIPIVTDNGAGTGATIDTFSVNALGQITDIAWDDNGSGYSAGDILTITQGGAVATYTVLAADRDGAGRLNDLSGKTIVPAFVSKGSLAQTRSDGVREIDMTGTIDRYVRAKVTLGSATTAATVLVAFTRKYR